MKLSSHFVLREIAGDNLLIPIGEVSSAPQGMILLNDISLRIYQAIGAGNDTDSILQDIIDHYEVEPEQARSDLNDVLSQMENLGIITIK